MTLKPEIRETRVAWVVAAMFAAVGTAAGLAVALGVRTPQQTAANHEIRLGTLETTVHAHDVILAGQGKDIEYIKDAVDEIRGHHGRTP